MQRKRRRERYGEIADEEENAALHHIDTQKWGNLAKIAGRPRGGRPLGRGLLRTAMETGIVAQETLACGEGHAFVPASRVRPRGSEAIAGMPTPFGHVEVLRTWLTAL